MCGIIGCWDRTGVGIDVAALDAATDVMKNRGPDDRGTWVGDDVALGHRRLAILDLTKAGHQPMSYLDRYVIVYNGEVYNFQEIRQVLSNHLAEPWQSNCDTEVILAAYHVWGVDCLQRFHGMFAIAVWDKVDRVLFLARDRFGVKPLYYHHSPKCFLFASRPQALLRLAPQLSKRLDESALRLYLEAGYIPAPHTIHEGIRKLPPAHYLLQSERELIVKPYWNFRHIVPEHSWKHRHEEDLLDELDDIVTRSVRQRMVSDAPLGAFLSGGIDSSLVVAKMATLSTRSPTTLTIGFAEKEFDESGPARAVANYLGTQHYSETLSVDALLKLMPEFLSEFDEPFFDYSCFPTMAVSRLARQHVTVSLSGDGGDELFGGYHYYQLARLLSPVCRLPKSARVQLSRLLGRLPGHQVQLLRGAISQDSGIGAFAFSRSISKDYPLPLVQAGALQRSSLADLFAKAARDFAPNLSLAEQAMRLDMCFTLTDDYLQKVDRSSMVFSLESREPLLDQDLVEWCMKLPLCWKMRGRQRKYLLRKLLYRYVPRELVDRRKMGFGVPMEQWLRGPLRSWANERFHCAELFSDLPIDQQRVLDLYALHCSGRRNVAPLLWALLVLLERFRPQTC